MQINIAIMRIFTKLRSFLLLEKGLVERMDKLENGTNKMFKIVFERLDSIEDQITPHLPGNRSKIGIKRGNNNEWVGWSTTIFGAHQSWWTILRKAAFFLLMIWWSQGWRDKCDEGPFSPQGFGLVFWPYLRAPRYGRQNSFGLRPTRHT